MSYLRINPTCRDERTCFARKNGKCTLLSDSYPPGRCPFCKEFRDVTGGRVYRERRRS